MTTEPPPGSGGQPPEEDPFRKQQPPSYGQPQGGDPYGSPYGSQQPPGYPSGTPYQGPPYGNDPYGGAPHGNDPLAGMPPLAPSGKRTLARIVDMILVGAVVALLTWAFRVNEYDMSGDDVNFGKSFWQSLVAAVLYMAYDTVLTARTGQTLGKKWLGMRVANLDNGTNPSMQTSLARAAVLWIPFAFCCACVWTAISGGWSYFDKPYKQGLHDKAAKTVVVSV
ncbi:RDD family protein [Streptomyces sp. V2]|uniref:RDD family protein n=1 Tax=Streptomyces niveiscabiei TaxID=164115 RepID=A0ABW9HTD5_9ACTN|nr:MULTISPECIES: RDD family protein [Streptomyces]PWG08597.1 RDD family protein [Streptomyces sp. V2]QZZ28076.1 RDD family protein [Streptomyces sp. ST1015]